MPSNPVAANVLGTMGAILWSIQLCPQLVKSYRRKTTSGLHSLMMLVWSVACVFLGSYVIVKDVNIPLIIQPQSMGVLTSLCAAQCFYYDVGTSGLKVSLIMLASWSTAAAVEVGFVFAARALEAKGIDSFTTFLGIMSVLLINIGFLPQIWTSFRLKEVFGISFIFLAIDSLGGIVSALSLVFTVSKDFDILAAISYLGPVFFELIIYTMALVLNPRAKRRRARENASVQDEPPLEEEEHHANLPDLESVAEAVLPGRVVETLKEKELREGKKRWWNRKRAKVVGGVAS